MRCKSRSCKNDECVQSILLELWSYCDECSSFFRLDKEDLETLESEGGLRYREYQWKLFQEKHFDRMDPRYLEHYKGSPTKTLTNQQRKEALARKAALRKEKAQPSGPPCKEHPRYGAVRKPRTDCETCWKAYNHKQRATHPV